MHDSKLQLNTGMNAIIISDENGDIMDVRFKSQPIHHKISTKRIRNFCFIDSICDYSYIFTPMVRTIMCKWRFKYDKPHQRTVGE